MVRQIIPIILYKYYRVIILGIASFAAWRIERSEQENEGPQKVKL
jgi:hypothetical protein